MVVARHWAVRHGEQCHASCQELVLEEADHQQALAPESHRLECLVGAACAASHQSQPAQAQGLPALLQTLAASGCPTLVAQAVGPTVAAGAVAAVAVVASSRVAARHKPWPGEGPLLAQHHKLRGLAVTSPLVAAHQILRLS